MNYSDRMTIDTAIEVAALVVALFSLLLGGGIVGGKASSVHRMRADSRRDIFKNNNLFAPGYWQGDNFDDYLLTAAQDPMVFQRALAETRDEVKLLPYHDRKMWAYVEEHIPPSFASESDFKAWLHSDEFRYGYSPRLQDMYQHLKRRLRTGPINLIRYIWLAPRQLWGSPWLV